MRLVFFLRLELFSLFFIIYVSCSLFWIERPEWEVIYLYGILGLFISELEFSETDVVEGLAVFGVLLDAAFWVEGFGCGGCYLVAHWIKLIYKA